MRRILLLILVMLSPTAAVADDIRHEIDLALVPSERRLEAVDRMTVKGREHFAFHLDPALQVASIKVDGAPVQPVERGSGMIVPLPDAGSHRIEIAYSGLLPAPDPAARHGGDRPVAGPEGSFLPAGSGWLPGGGADGEWRLTVRVPLPQKAVATGSLDEEGTEDGWYRAVFASRGDREGPSLFAGPYRIAETRRGGLLLRAYMHDEVAGLSDDYLKLAGDYVTRFADAIGPYPFDRFDIVSAPLPVGLGFPGLTYVGRRVLPLPFMRGQSLAHEVLHNWWGNAVVPAYDDGNWAEGLTTYMADHALAGPERAREMRMGWLEDYAALPADRDAAATSFRAKQHDAAQIVGYNKVAFFFHMLRNAVGEEAFAEGIRQFWKAHKFDVAGWPDLRAAFEAASGQDLEHFFRQWLDRPGAPSLRLADAKAEPEAGRWRVTVRIAQDEPGYRLTVPVAVESPQGRQVFRVALDGREAESSFLVMERPTAVAVDPDYDLFRRLAPGEAPTILRDVTLASDVSTVIAAKGPAAETAARLAEALLDTAAVNAVSPEQAAEAARPVLVIGLGAAVPDALARLGAPPVPDAVAGGDARAWTFRLPGGGNGLAVAADTPEALAGLLRPLPHYGRQSYLVFANGKAILKGRWPSSAEGMRAALR